MRIRKRRQLRLGNAHLTNFTQEELPGGVTKISVGANRTFLTKRSISLVVVLLLLCTCIVADLSGMPFLPREAIVLGILLVVLLGLRSSPPLETTNYVESVLVFPGLGVQIESPGRAPRFIPASEIEFFSINEGFERCGVVVYLILVTVSKRCVVLFDETRPSIDSLVRSFEVLDSWLAKIRPA